MMRKCIALFLTLGLLISLGIGGAAAADYPKRPITLICPWGAGGGTDACSRVIATLLKKELGVPVNVVNRTGGSGAVGHTAMATAKPDGYTIGMATGELAMMHWMGLTEITYKDIVPICMVNADPSGINVRTDSQWKTVQELEDYVKKNPGKLKDSGSGHGGIWHLAMAGWMKGIGQPPDAIKCIPSKGAAPALQDLMANGIDMSTCSLPEAATLIEAGKVRPLAIMSDKRDPKFPDTPTLKELGNDWIAAAVRGIVGPKGTPPEIVAVLEKAIAKVHKSPEFIKFMNGRGYGMVWKDAATFTDFLVKIDADYGKVMKAAGLTK